MEPLRPKLADQHRHPGRVRNRAVRVGTTSRFGRIDAGFAAHLIETLGALVVRLQGLVIDRPGWREPIDLLDGAEVLAAQAIEHAAPEFRVTTNAVVGVRREFPPATIAPAFLRAVAELLPHRVGIPVLDLTRHEIAAFDNENARRSIRQRARHRTAPRAGADDDDVVVLVHCGALRVVTRVLAWNYIIRPAQSRRHPV